MKVFKIPHTPYQVTIWWWHKADNRQKKPTHGFGFIVERR